MGNNNVFIEKSLKRYVKSKKIGYTASLLVGFLITGNIVYAENVYGNKIEIEEKIKANNKRIEEIEKRTVELLKEGDYYAKTLENNRQFFFPLNYEHRHSSKEKRTEIASFEPAKPEMNVPDRVEIPVPGLPSLPEKNEGNADIDHIHIGDIPEPPIEPPTPEIEENIKTPHVNKETITEVNQSVGNIDIDTYIDMEGGADTVIDITEGGFKPNRPEINYAYTPKEPVVPEFSGAKPVEKPEEINLPEIDIVIGSFAQGSAGIIKNKEYNQAVVENYGNYKVEDGKTLKITFNDNADTKKNEIKYEGLENFGLITGKGSSVLNNIILQNFRKDFYGYINDKDWIGKAAAFISNTAPGKSTISGNYEINYAGTDYNEKVARIFLSVNPAGVGGTYNSEASYDQWGNANGGSEGNNLSSEEKRKARTIFDGTLTLTNQTENGILLGIDHQLWDSYVDGGNQDGFGDYNYMKSYSVAENAGTINLGNEDGNDKNLVGISITQERETRALQKLNNHVTLNSGEIKINGNNSIGIAYETGVKTNWDKNGSPEVKDNYKEGKIFSDDLYIGNINFGTNSKNSYGIRLKNIEHYDNKNLNLKFTDEHKYDNTRVFGSLEDNIGNVKENLEGLSSGKINKISVNGTNNGGFVVAKSLSANAERYLIKDETGKDINKGDDPNVKNPVPDIKDEDGNIVDYTGIFNDDIKIKDEQGKEIAFKGYETGKVDPIANIHGLNIEVNGKSNVGFLRYKDYSENNTNDMVITNTSTSAIKDIDFGKNASGSVLIRSDMYGINVEKDLTIEGDGTKEGSQNKSEENTEEKQKNIILQATRSIWDKENKTTGQPENVKSVGNITNIGNMTSSMSNVVGMMSNDAEKPENIKFEEVDGLNGYKKEKAEIKNTGDIILTGKNVIGMAVLNDNLGILENGKVDTTMSGFSKTDEKPENITEIKDYNVSIYNNGTFDIKNSEILTSGTGSVAVYNIAEKDKSTGKVTISADKGQKNVIKADHGAVGLYSNGGSITSTGAFELTSESLDKEGEKGGIGIYGINGAKITIGENSVTTADGTDTSSKENIIKITNGDAGIASVGTGTEVTLNNTDLTYSGKGYALYDKEGGKININNSVINLDGRATGMKVDFGKGNNNNITLNNSKINVKSNDVVVFDIVSTEENKFTSDLSKLEENIGIAVGGIDIKDAVTHDEGIDNYITAMVDGGNLTIDQSISQTDAKNTLGDFYFKRFLGVRLNTTVKENVNVAAEITGADADKYFNGKVTGLEIVSSKNAKGFDDTSITLERGATVTANRLDGTQKEGTATVGVFADFAKVDMKDGSKIIVEKKSETSADDKSYKGAGLFVVNGSTTNVGTKYNSDNVDENAKIEVYGDNAIGVYAKSFRLEDGKILDNEYGEQKGQGKIDVTNNGIIDVSNGTGTVGIYADNNKTGATDNSNSKVANNGYIKVGSSNKEKSSVGIYGNKTSIDNKGIVEVGNGERDGEDGAKHGGVGIYAVNDSKIENMGTIVLGNYAIGIVVDATSEIDNNASLIFKENSVNAERQSKIGIAYNNINSATNEEIIRQHNIEINSTDINGLRAIASNGGNLQVNSNITIGDNNNRAIILTGGTAENNGTITIKKSKNPSETSSVAMVAMDKNSTISNNGTINLNGNSSIGMFVKNTDDNSGNKIGTVGTINLNGTGNTGIYIKNSVQDLALKDFVETADKKGVVFGANSDKSTGIHIHDSDKITVAEKGEKISQELNNENILLKATGNSTVMNNGILEITSNDTKGKDVGIALDETSNYNGTGEIHVAGGAIGLYSKAGESKTFESLKLKVDSRNENAIGFALRGKDDKDSNSKISINGTTEIELSNSAKVEENPDGLKENKAVGIIARDSDLSFGDINLKYNGSTGIGVYLKDNAVIEEGTLNISLAENTVHNHTAYSVGVYVNSEAGTDKENIFDINMDINIDKDKAIGIYNDKGNTDNQDTENPKTTPLKYNGTINVNSKDAIGIYNGENKSLEFSGAVNVTGENVENGASVGIYAKGNSNITNKGTVTVNGARDVGIYGNNFIVNNEKDIIVNGGTGVYLAGENSVFNGIKGTISTNFGEVNGKSETAVYLKDGAKLGNGIGNLTLGKGDVGVYAENTTVDGSTFISKESGKGNFFVSGNDNIGENETGAIGLALEDSNTKNLNMILGNNSMGIFGINGKISAKNISISSEETDTATGIYLENKKDNFVTQNEIENIEIKLNGYGIVMEDSEEGKGTELKVTNGNFNVQNILSDKNSAAVVVGKNNKFISVGDSTKNDKDNYRIDNNIGIYGKENSLIEIIDNSIGILGKSTGIYSNGGSVKLDEKTSIGIITGKEANGGAVFVQNGTIESNAEITGFSSDFYGLALTGNGSIINGGKIDLSGENDIGIALFGSPVDEKNTIDNSGNILIKGNKGKKSVGILGRNTDIENSGNMLIKENAVGIYYDNSQSKNSHKVNSTGNIYVSNENAVGALFKGKAESIKIENIADNGDENSQKTIGIYTDNLNTDSMIVNNISLKNNSLGMYMKNSTATVTVGNISVLNGEGQTNRGNNASVGFAVSGGEVSLNIKDKISAGKNGTAIFNDNGKIEINDIEKLSVEAGYGSLIHSNGGVVTLKDDVGKENYEINVDGHYGFILENGGKIQGDENFLKKNLTINVSNNGTGIIFSQTKGEADKDRPFSDIGVDKIILNGSGTDGLYTKGVYYKNLGEVTEDIEDVIIEQNGKNTAGVVFNGTYGILKTGDIFLGEEAQDSVAVLVKGNEDENHVTTITGNLIVKDGNKEGAEQKFGNIGFEAQNSSLSTDGTITVGEGFSFANSYPVGVYAVNSNKDKNYIYTGNGDLTVGNFATGVAAKNFNILYNGNITAGVGAVGIVAENDEYISGKHYVTALGNIIVGDEKLSDSDRIKGTGIYSKNSDIFVGTKDDHILMNIKNNKQNIGILSTEKGNVEFNGDVNIVGSETVERGKDSSTGIYKLGSGRVDIGKGNWTVGNNSFGIIADSGTKNQDTLKDGIILTNESQMTVQKGAVGIYSSGNITVANKGDMKINGGTEKGKSSVGIYMQNDNTDKAAGTNTAEITVDGKNAVGIQAVGNVEFSNEGTINVLNDGIGMFAVNGASVYNSKTGVINLGDENGIGSAGAVGMYAKGQGSKIFNEGIINANNGVGMYVSDGAELYNSGDINLKNGVGIKGNGTLVNTGNINIEAGYTGIDIDKDGGSLNSSDDIIKIDSDAVIIGDRYTGLGGTLNSDFDLNLKNPTIDITAGNGLGFNAPNISGGITAAPNFAGTGNGYSFDIKDFAGDDVNLEVNTSPLFDGKITDGDLSMNKVDYKDILKDYQYEEFYNSLDDTLKTGVAEDIDAIKNLNTYLESFGNSDEFYEQYDKIMGETRGSIYSHVQSRMQDINRAFDNAFDEMETSYNLSKNTDKFSLIYTNGDYKNGKTQIPDYDYRITGLLYMKEYEGTESRDKHGYSYGFTGSRFKFGDTGSSKEDVYSVKGGLHNVKYFDKDLNLLTKLEAGINYHETDRTLAFGSYKYENDSDFWSYYISFDNKFRKTLYENYQNEFGAYLGFETEYGRFTDIKEDGTLALKIKGNDYLSAKAAAGFNGTARKYLGNDWTGKIMGDIGYSYDFGHNYGENSSKLKRTESGYVSLMSEIETKGKVTGKIGIGAERLNYMGVTLEAEAAKDFERDEEYWRVGLRFNYKFNSEDAVTTLRNTFNLFGNHFDFDKDNLKRKEQDIIEAGSKIIDKHNLKGTLVLEGHTDSYGSVEYNQGLSERRAETVKRELSSQITKSGNIKYKTKGYSELKPVDTNKTAEGRANNRRVEVKYIPDSKNKTAE